MYSETLMLTGGSGAELPASGKAALVDAAVGVSSPPLLFWPRT